MNAKHYNNVIDWTLKHDTAAQTEDSLATARAIFNNMGVALPNGSIQEVYDTIKTNQYMGWHTCTMQEAQQAANNGIAAIGISQDRIVVLSATDAEEPVAETASVMTLSENTSVYSVAGLEYYTYRCCTTTHLKAWPYAETPTFFTRADWGARSARTSEMTLRDAAQRIIFHHSAEKFDKTNLADVIEEIQRIQNYQMDESDEGFSDIAYNFIIDPCGRIWKGRSLRYKGGHAYGYNDDIGVLLLGDFELRLFNLNPNTLNDRQKGAMKALSKWLCYTYDLSKIESGVNIAPISTHETVNDTECPGDNAKDWIKEDLRNYIANWGANCNS